MTTATIATTREQFVQQSTNAALASYDKGIRKIRRMLVARQITADEATVLYRGCSDYITERLRSIDELAAGRPSRVGTDQ